VYRYAFLTAILVSVTTTFAADTTCKTEEAKFCKGMKGTALAKCMDSHKTEVSESCQLTPKVDPLKGASPADKAGAMFNPTGNMGTVTK